MAESPQQAPPPILLDCVPDRPENSRSPGQGDPHLRPPTRPRGSQVETASRKNPPATAGPGEYRYLKSSLKVAPQTRLGPRLLLQLAPRTDPRFGALNPRAPQPMRFPLVGLAVVSALTIGWLFFSTESEQRVAAQPLEQSAVDSRQTTRTVESALVEAGSELLDLADVDTAPFAGRSEARLEPWLPGCSRGLVVDRDRGKPVPHASFSVVGESAESPIPREWTVQSDSKGRVLFDPPLLEVFGLRQVNDHPVPRLSKSPFPDPSSGEKPWRIVLDAAPTFRFEVQGATPSEAAQLQLVGLSPQPIWDTPVSYDEFGWWARPPKGARWLASAKELAILDLEGFRFAALPTSVVQEALESGHGGPLTFALQSTGSVDIDLEIESRELEGARPILWHISTSLLPLDRVVDRPPRHWTWRKRRWLRPGRYLVEATGAYHEPFRQEIDVVGGLKTEVSGRVEFPAQTRSVTLEASTRDGSPLKPFSLELERVGATSNPWSFRYPPELVDPPQHSKPGPEPARTERTLRFIPFGPLRVRVLSSEAPLEITLHGPEDGDVHVQVIQADPLGPGIGFHLTGGPLLPHEPSTMREIQRLIYPGAGWRAFTRRAKTHVRLEGNFRSGEIAARLDPTVTKFDWALTRAGSIPIYGDQDSFVPEGNGRFFARGVSRKGWGTTLIVCDEHGNPVIDARVLVEGDFAGRTNAEGEYLLEREASPSSVVVEDPLGELEMVEAWDRWSNFVVPEPWIEVHLRTNEMAE